jgi:PadR family transcriptional regulator PadR
MAATNPSFMNGVPELLVLRLLRNGEMYGYQIVQAIRDETGEVVNLGEGVVYPVQRRAVNGRSRIYYALSPAGASRLTELTDLWARVTGAVQQVLVGDAHASLV